MQAMRNVLACHAYTRLRIQMTKKSDKEFFDKAGNEADEKAATEEEQNAAPWWNFEGKGGEEAHPTFQGRFVSAEYKEKQGSNGPYDCLMCYFRDIDKDETLYKVWFSAGGAVRGMRDASPAVGTLLMVRFEGEQDSSTSGRKFKAYSVVADEQDDELWGSYMKAYQSRSVQVAQSGPKDLAPDEAPF
jgi:hypothetical protein